MTPEKLDSLSKKLLSRAFYMREAGHDDDAELDERVAGTIAALSAKLTEDEAALAQSRAETQAALAVCVKVKPLVWQKSAIKPWAGDWHTVPTGYTVRWADLNGWKWSRNGAFGYCHSDEAAKAAAQADHDARSLAAIQPDTSKLAQIREALEVIRSRSYYGLGAGVTAQTVASAAIALITTQGDANG